MDRIHASRLRVGDTDPQSSASDETLSQRPALGISYRARVGRPETQLNVIAAAQEHDNV
jgi:hypothetical protein